MMTVDEYWFIIRVKKKNSHVNISPHFLNKRKKGSLKWLITYDNRKQKSPCQCQWDTKLINYYSINIHIHDCLINFICLFVIRSPNTTHNITNDRKRKDMQLSEWKFKLKHINDTAISWQIGRGWRKKISYRIAGECENQQGWGANRMEELRFWGNGNEWRMQTLTASPGRILRTAPHPSPILPVWSLNAPFYYHQLFLCHLSD